MMSAKWRRQMFKFEALTTTRACSSKSFILFLSLHRENHTCQASQSARRLFCTWPTWNNPKTLNLTQSFNWMRRFRCNRRRSFLNTLISIYRAKWQTSPSSVKRAFSRAKQKMPGRPWFWLVADVKQLCSASEILSIQLQCWSLRYL